MAKGLTLEEASAKVGEKNYESIVKQNKNAAAFSNTVSQIKEAFMNALSGSEGFKTLFSEDNIKHYVDSNFSNCFVASFSLNRLIPF